MAVINYKKEYVSFDYKEGWSNDPWAIPSIEFFIHVWQRASNLKDVVDTFEQAFQMHGNTERHRLLLDAISSRASRWRDKGVELQYLGKTSSLDALKRLARQECF